MNDNETVHGVLKNVNKFGKELRMLRFGDIYVKELDLVE